MLHEHRLGLHRNTVRVSAPAAALLVMGCMASAKGSDQAPVTRSPSAAAQSAPSSERLPDIGTKMPDGTVYAGLSMDTGKPSFVAAAGTRMPDGSIYAGISPDTGKRLYTTAADAPGVYTWSRAVQYCKRLSTSGHHDWHMPSLGELAVQFGNRADIGGFNESGKMAHASGYYWSSLQVGDGAAWGQLFSDGFHEDFDKDLPSSLRCVR
jgi:hypothetical protein